MPDTVTVTEAQGARYTWASAGFNWASASAGKTWNTAYPAVHGVAVAVSLALLEDTARQIAKRSGETLGFTESRTLQIALRHFEALGLSETYSDYIAYVLRWVETLAFAEEISKSGRKSVSEAFQAADYLGRVATKAVQESLPIAESLGRQAVKRHAESFPIAESAHRSSTKASADSFGVGEDLKRGLTKRMAEALNFAETYTDLIAFILAVSENLGVSETGSKQTRKPIAEFFTATDHAVRQSVKRVAEAVAMGEALGRSVAYRRYLDEGLAVSDALRRALGLAAHEALALAEQYRRRANGVVSDMIVSSAAITETDFANIVEAGHPPGYTDFRDFIQGDYTYRRALFRALLKSRNSDRGFIEALRVTVDVPDIFDRGTAQITDADAGVSINFTRTFRVPPEVTMTHKGGTAVAIPRLLGVVTTTGFSAVLESTSGTRLTGSFTWIAQGY